MIRKSSGKKVAILVADGFEQVELEEPRRALEEAGMSIFVVSPSRGAVKSWNAMNWGRSFPVDVHLEETDSSHFDALLLPGGVMNSDKLRQNRKAVDFIRAFFDEGKPVGAICHGPLLLAEAGVIQGRNVTSHSSIKTDLKNAGAQWIDQEVVSDGGLITSRGPEDISAFVGKLIEEFEEGFHEEQRLKTVQNTEM